MDRRSNCYLNSAYNRNLDDFDDFIDIQSQLSFDSKGLSYESENETYVDEIVEDYNECYSEDNRLSAIDQKSTNVTPQKSRYNVIYDDSFLLENSQSKLDKSASRLTSTPKKQCTLSERKNPYRREAIVRRRSFSAPSRKEYGSFAENNRLPMAIRRSKSSLSLSRQKFDERSSQRENQRLIAPKFTSANPYHKQYTRSRSLHNFTDPDGIHLQNVSSVPPFQMYNPSANVAMRRNNPFLRRPYDLNSSFSSSRPLITSRNTAVISPIYSKQPTRPTFDIRNNSPPRNAFTIAADRSSSSTKSWLQMRKQSIPLCTLRTSAAAILLSGTLSCLLCIHIISFRGKSYELTLSLITSFITLCLGFPCFHFQDWQWLPNRNYVSGYVVLSLFSILLSSTLWILDKYPNLTPEVVDLMKGALWGLCSLTLSISLLGVCTSCCCKYPPPDNRVTHGVEGFNV